MVNYLYALGEIEKNHEALAEKGVVAASEAVRQALQSQPPRRPTAA
jgi:malonyl-CoA decarboxylase